MSRRLVDQLREIGVRSPCLQKPERRVIDPWVAEHPLRDIAFVRDSPVARFAEHVRTLGGVSQSVGTVEELAIAVSQQARIYLADLPPLLRGEVDLMRLDMLASQDLASMQGDLHVAATGAGRLASTGESLPALVENERRIVR